MEEEIKDDKILSDREIFIEAFGEKVMFRHEVDDDEGDEKCTKFWALKRLRTEIATRLEDEEAEEDRKADAYWTERAHNAITHCLPEHKKWLNDESTGKQFNMNGREWCGFERQRYVKNLSLGGADLRRASLCDADLRKVNITNVDFSGAYLAYIELSHVDLTTVKLKGANLSHALLEHSNLTGVDLIYANISSAYLAHSILIGANLTGTDFSNADLSNCDLTDAILINTNFTDANLTDATLPCAALKHVILKDAVLENVRFI